MIFVGLSGLTHSHPGHDLLDHDELAPDIFCVVSYAKIAQAVDPDSPDYPEFEARGRGLARLVHYKAVNLGHTEQDLTAAVFEMSKQIVRLHIDDWIAFGEYVDCVGRTQEYAQGYWF